MAAIITMLFSAAFFILILLAVLTSVFTVSQQTVRIVETFGKFSSIRTAGLNFKLPWPFQTVSEPISLKIEEFVVTPELKFANNTFAKTPIRTQFRVLPDAIETAYYKLGNPIQQLESYIVSQVLSSAAKIDFDDLYSSKETLEQQAKQALIVQMTDFGYSIENVLIEDPQPSERIRDSYESVVASQRLLEASRNEGEALRIKEVAKAKAEAEALELRGKALVAFRNTISTGNAQAVEQFCQGTGLSATVALQFIQTINEMETLSRIGESGGRVTYISASAKEAGINGTTGALLGADHDQASNAGPRKRRKADADSESSKPEPNA